MKQLILFLIFIQMTIAVVIAQSTTKEFTTSSLKAMGAPNNPKVEIAWNRYYDWKEIGDICRRLAKAFPKLIHYSSIGKSVEGRNLHLLTVSNFEHGNPDRKPAMYIDGNIHSNEIQGAEVALYTAWFLAENYNHIEWITELLNNKTFYIVPTINPDARDYYIHNANTPHSPRSGMLPRDDDGDGFIDEDGFDDLDDDGNIVRMRKSNPNGRWKIDPENPLIMIRAKIDEAGEYDMLGWEGYDNDGDGLVNEDGPGYYDPNRNWAWNWEPHYIQSGADQYPFSIPENRAVADFVMAHPNIGGAQSYHNSGGMIIRGPGAQNDLATYDNQDLKYYDYLANLGEEMLPGYRYLVLYKDMYSVYGGELDWFYGARGIFTFTNELWTTFDYFRKRESGTTDWLSRQQETTRFNKLLLFEEGIVPWKKMNHPQYGEIEIGGAKKSWTRTAPSFMIEDMCHRNMAFTLFHAYHLPLLSIDSITVKNLGENMKQVDVLVKNNRVLPTRSSQEVQHKILPPDYISIDKEVIAGFIVENDFLNLLTEQKYHPQKIEVETIAGMGTVHARWITAEKPPYKITIHANKGGMISKTVR